MLRPLLFAIAATLIASAPARADGLDLSAGRLHFALTGGGNARLTLDNVPVIRESSLFLVAPGWTGVYLNQEEMTPQTTTDGPRSGTAVYETEQGYARYRFELEPDSFRMTVVYGVKQAGTVEGQVRSYLNANLLEGAAYAADTADGPLQGKIPEAPLDPARNRILPPARRIALDTRLGGIEITVSASDPAVSTWALDDYRSGKQEWARRNPMMWFGAQIPRMKETPGEQSVTVTYRFTPKARPAAPAPRLAAPKVFPVAAARVPYVPEFPVIPRPKESVAGSKPFRITPATRLVIADAPSPEEKQAARDLQAELRGFYGERLPIVRVRQLGPAGPRPTDIRLLVQGKAAPRADVPDHVEGYWLRTGEGFAGVVGHDPRGVLNGAQTLRQLIRVDKSGVFLKPVAIRDWPSMAVRGVHWFGGPQAGPFHARMLDRILAPYKLNTMLYEVDWAHWDSQPKAHHPQNGMPKSEIAATVRRARLHFIEPIPLIETLGNSDWLFVNGQNRDLQYSDNYRSYDPRNPKSYDAIFRVFEEAIALFQPKYFHIGHDEITVPPPHLPPAGVTESAPSIITKDVERLDAWLAARGIRTMMWGDQLLHYPEDATDAGWAPGVPEAAALRKSLPKDVVIADWHYQGDSPAFPSVALLQDAGYTVVGATWFDRDNIVNFARALAARHAIGMIQTTWAGFSMTEPMVTGDALPQFVGYLIAAECAWNGGQNPLESLGYEPEDAFRAAWERGPVDRTVRPGFLVDLSSVANSSLPSGLGSGFTAKENIHHKGTKTQRTSENPLCPSCLCGEFVALRDTSASSAVNPGTYLADTAYRLGPVVALAGGLETAARPESVTLKIGRAAAELRFLWGTTYATERGAPVARLRVTYADGETVEAPVRYGTEIWALSDGRGGSGTVTAWRGQGADGRPLSVRRWAWVNPRPKAPIAAVTLTSMNTEAAPVLYGLTGVDVR